MNNEWRCDVCSAVNLSEALLCVTCSKLKSLVNESAQLNDRKASAQADRSYSELRMPASMREKFRSLNLDKEAKNHNNQITALAEDFAE